MKRNISRLISGLKNLRREIYIHRNNLINDRFIFTHMTLDELICLHKVIKRFREKKINAVEIGSYLGASSCFISNAMNQQSVLYCIDTWENDAMKYSDSDVDAEKRDTYSEFKRNTIKYTNKIKEIRKWSTEAIDEISNEISKIDFLFIDGDHTYEGVKDDWNLYSPLLGKNSVIAFHDTGWAEGVQRVIEESVKKRAILLQRLPNLEIYKTV